MVGVIICHMVLKDGSICEKGFRVPNDSAVCFPWIVTAVPSKPESINNKE